MLVGKRKCFEDEPSETRNPTFALRRRITQERNLETLCQARKRITLQNLAIIQEKYPQIQQSDILRLLEDFDNNVEIVFEILGQKASIPQKFEIGDADFDNYKKALKEELLKRLQQSQNIQSAQQVIQLCFDAFEQKLGEKYQSNTQRLEDENKLLKQAFLKQHKRIEKIRVEAENKEKQNQNLIKSLTEENKQQQQINNNLTILLIQAQQNNTVSTLNNINNDIY
ncbi:unnamed protein product (macronuclear) [Paramecium tetraurelia]|uniref:CUE domain-containing protein n=1 Tax=Paramecium tetraurelia TaxID=5888 RepID=A0CCX0_PARTE|nr:uncharacterized protein GSPATT00037422001 [Paramecium tetraurelia]CAK68637.1 unnamed protein product [Paramecium tetraurelia]|eukprot:XP_001436034.1 hypothetical protein (macronuclear) [Paramecium tetraurelia strain d4-2]